MRRWRGAIGISVACYIAHRAAAAGGKIEAERAAAIGWSRGWGLLRGLLRPACPSRLGPILRRAGLLYRKPHALRHTYASLLIEAGESLKYVQEQLGHHSPGFTLSVYGHLIPRGDRRAVDRLDDENRNPGATSARERLETPENIEPVSEPAL